MIIFPSDKILPPPSILQKLNALDPDAARKIVDRALEIGKERMEKRDGDLFDALDKTESRNRGRAFWTGFATAFNFFGGFDPVSDYRKVISERRAPETNINLVWANIGNDMRKAIGEYIRDNKALTAGLVLTRKEKDGLRLLEIPVATVVGRVTVMDRVSPYLRPKREFAL